MEKKHYQTKGRTCLLEYLKNEASATARSAEEILAALASDRGAPAQSSGYRMLAELCRSGEVRKFRAEAGYIYQYVGTGRACEHHFHLQCTVCGEVSHLECACSNEIAEHLSRTHRFSVDRGRSVLYGTCAQCAAKGGEA